MRTALILVPLLLAACATPRESCIADATRDLRVINALIEETRGNIQRGYAVEERQDVRVIRRTCSDRDDDGSIDFFSCDRTRVFTRNVPQAIDLNAERAKLQSMIEQRDRLQAAVQPALRQCIATYPE